MSNYNKKLKQDTQIFCFGLNIFQKYVIISYKKQLLFFTFTEKLPMALIINNIRASVSEDAGSVIEKALKSSGIRKSDTVKTGIYKTSLDARKQSDIHFVHSVYAELGSAEAEKKFCQTGSCQYVDSEVQKPVICTDEYRGRIAVVGFGPAGLFCALVLSENGYKPIVFERGESVEERAKSVEAFWNGGPLNINSNVQFGEGGAGTFSDGKLTTRIRDPFCRYVLDSFVRFGAPEDILIKAKPHIGTDKLRSVIKAMRERIIKNGGEVHFGTTVTGFDTSSGRIGKVHTTKGDFDAAAVVLAVGNSARDTFEMLFEKQIMMQPKPFSVGVRIEHLQESVNESLYGRYKDNPFLPAGEYQLSYRDKEGRGVYTFCMCPGGTVVPSASEENTVVTNGMSEFARDGRNANAAVAVSVSEKDFGTNPLDGMYFARVLECKAFELAGQNYKAPATTVGGFMRGKPSLDSCITPTFARGLSECDFNKLFDEKINQMLMTGLKDFGRKMKCFSDGNAIMTAPETRTSSPLRILRNENLVSPSLENLYPCGEGAGYAGGITSAAVDGIKTAYRIMEQYAPEK